jgi:hypothetical protein
MKEYIEREFIDNLLQKHLDDWCGQEYYATSIIQDEIDEAPSADVAEVVHGHWINVPPYRALNGSYNKGQECSVCHAFFVSPGNTPYSNHPYCCECGAKMNGGNIDG